MNILFHVAVGNTDRPRRWNFVNVIFSNLAETFTKLGYNCLVYVHPEACTRNKPFKNNIISKTVNNINFKPDFVFTWNGVSDGDKQIINKYGQHKMIYAELAFFDHYETVFFDFSGVNGKSESLIANLDKVSINDDFINSLVKKYQKPRLIKEPFVFIPLQDEGDSQIVNYSPFKKMDDLLDYVDTLYSKKDIKILYKKHPKAKTTLKKRSSKFIEVSENVHHYIPYAEKVIGINTNVLLETLLYHNRIFTIGVGITSRTLNSDIERKKYITYLYNKQFKWGDMKNLELIKNSYLNKELIKLYGSSRKTNSI